MDGEVRPHAAVRVKVPGTEGEAAEVAANTTEMTAAEKRSWEEERVQQEAAIAGEAARLLEKQAPEDVVKVVVLDIRSVQDVLSLVREETDRVAEWERTMRKLRYEKRQAEMKVAFDRNEAAIKAKTNNKKKKKPTKKKKAAAQARLSNFQLELKDIPVPPEPEFEVLTPWFVRAVAFREDQQPSNARLRSFKRKRVIRHPIEFEKLVDEWLLRKEEVFREILCSAVKDLVDLLAEGPDPNTCLFECARILSNQNVHDLCVKDLARIGKLLLDDKPAVTKEWSPVFKGLVLWSLGRSLSTGRAVLQKLVQPHIAGVLARELNEMSTLMSSVPAKQCFFFIGAVSWFSQLSGDQSLGTEPVHDCLTRIARRANDGEIVVGALVSLCNSIDLFLRNEQESEPAKARLFAMLSDVVASPRLLVHGINTNREMVRCDLGSILLCSAALTKGCGALAPDHGADLIGEGPALRRIVSLSEWSYESVVIYEETQNAQILGDFTLASSKIALGEFLQQADCAFAANGESELIRLATCKVILLQAVFLLSVAMDGVKPPPAEGSAGAILEQVGSLLIKATQLVRRRWIEIEQQKEVEREELIAELKDRREMEALRALELGTVEEEDGAQLKEHSEGDDDDGDDTVVVPPHEHEWWLRTVEFCSLVALRSMLDGEALSVSFIEEAFDNGLLSHLTRLADCVSEASRACNIDIFNILFRSCEESQSFALARKLAGSLEPVLVIDLMLRYPDEENMAFLLSCVMKYSDREASSEITSSVITLLEQKGNSVTPEDESSCLMMMHLVDILMHAARDAETRALMGREEGGSVVEVVLAALAKILSFPNRQPIVFDCVMHIAKAFKLILQDTNNVECFTHHHGIAMVCALVEEFSGLALSEWNNVIKRKYYEILIETLKLLRIIIMTRSVMFQRAVLTAEVMDVLFTLACGDMETEAPRKTQKMNAQCKRLAASVLTALPFKQEVGEPCVIAVARKFICSDYSEIPAIQVEQQSFGAQMFSRAELTENGHELLRRSNVVKMLLRFACCPVNDDPELGSRRTHALVGLLFLCAENAKTQEYVCSAALFQLLKLAWTVEQNHDHALIGRLLEQLSQNKRNRTRIYKAEMRARAIVMKAALQDQKVASRNADTAGKPDVQARRTAEQPLKLSAEEQSAQSDLETILGMRKEFNRWLRKDLKIKEKTPKDAAASAQGKSSNRKRLPALSSTAKATKKTASSPTKTRRSSLCMSPEESPFWRFRDSILCPSKNPSVVAKSNSRRPEQSDDMLMTPALYQPAKLLWTNQEMVQELGLDKSVDDDNLQGSKGPHAEAKSGATRPRPWAQPKSVDPFVRLVDHMPKPSFILDLDVPSLEPEPQMKIRTFHGLVESHGPRQGMAEEGQEEEEEEEDDDFSGGGGLGVGCDMNKFKKGLEGQARRGPWLRVVLGVLNHPENETLFLLPPLAVGQPPSLAGLLPPVQHNDLDFLEALRRIKCWTTQGQFREPMLPFQVAVRRWPPPVIPMAKEEEKREDQASVEGVEPHVTDACTFFDATASLLGKVLQPAPTSPELLVYLYPLTRYFCLRHGPIEGPQLLLQDMDLRPFKKPSSATNMTDLDTVLRMVHQTALSQCKTDEHALQSKLRECFGKDEQLLFTFEFAGETLGVLEELYDARPLLERLLATWGPMGTDDQIHAWATQLTNGVAQVAEGIVSYEEVRQALQMEQLNQTRVDDLERICAALLRVARLLPLADDTQVAAIVGDGCDQDTFLAMYATFRDSLQDMGLDAASAQLHYAETRILRRDMDPKLAELASVCDEASAQATVPPKEGGVRSRLSVVSGTRRGLVTDTTANARSFRPASDAAKLRFLLFWLRRVEAGRPGKKAPDPSEREALATKLSKRFAKLGAFPAMLLAHKALLEHPLSESVPGVTPEILEFLLEKS